MSTSPALPEAPTLRLPLSPALRARVLGTGVVAIGLLVLLSVLLTWALDLPGAVLTALVGVATLGLLALLGLLLPRHWVVRLDADGYRVRGLRSAEARSARWSDVRDVQTSTVGGARCTTLRLRDGRTTTLPVDVVACDPAALTQAITAHLDRTHGYRRLRR